jgi:hypothetical protein
MGMQHPLCSKCYDDERKRKEYEADLKREHPDLYEDYKEAGR